MSDKPVRSKTGCLTCKTRRKKCDEGRPTCDRCARAKMECLGYTYLDNPEELIQARAKVAARSSTARSPATTSSFDARYQSVSPFSLEADPSSPIGRNQYLVRSHSVPSGLPSSSSANYNAGPAGPTLATDNAHTSTQTFSFVPQHMGPGDLGSTSSRETLWWGNNRSTDTFRGGNPHEGFTSQSSSTTQMSSLRAVGSTPQKHFGDHSGYIGTYLPQGEVLAGERSRSRLSSPAPSDEVPYDCDSESTDTSDREGVREAVCGTPLGTSSSNDALRFVLQSYANWAVETLFDPYRMAHFIRSDIIEQFGASEDSRATVISTANVVRSIGRAVALDSNQTSDLAMLSRRAQHAIEMFRINEQHIYEQGSEIALKTLSYILQVLSVHLALSPLGTSVGLLREAALVFKRVVNEQPGHPVNLPSQLSAANSDVRRYSILDVVTSLGTGCQMAFPYDVSYTNPPFDSSSVYGDVDGLGLQWTYGCPEEFLVILARMHNIRDAPTYMAHAREIDEIEAMIRDWQARGFASDQPHLAIARLVINECWRQTLIIYLLMGISRASSGDIRVAQALKVFLKLLKTVQPARYLDMFLLFPLLVAAVASHRHKDRNKIYERAQTIRECRIPNTAGSDILAMMVNIWSRVDSESRPIYWSDVKVAFCQVSGL